jgi:aerobic-type carbon monoxide dehydrogenase small subunit (CoxS/CutS family)
MIAPAVPDREATTIPIYLTVNGQQIELRIEPAETLAEVLRESLHLIGTKISCDMQVCGACTVLVDDLPVSACTFLAYEARDRSVLTIEGIACPDGRLHPLQNAFIAENAFQCGFCTPGMILAAKSLLDLRPDVDEAGIIAYMEGNLCRCTGYRPIVRAIQQAQRAMTDDGADG